MSFSQNLRRRGRSGDSGLAAGRESTSGPASGSDALEGLREAVTDLDPVAFARCFSARGWVRVPRPEGDVVLRGPAEIEQLGHELRQQLIDLTWTPSQRFVAAGQVVEEGVARARMAPDPDGENTPNADARVPMRVVAALDSAGEIGSLTLWVDWAAIRDPLGVDSAGGAASALVAQARARDSRGLRVIESETGPALLPPPPIPTRVTDSRAPGPPRPPATVLWWKRHRATLAGSAMALAATVLIGWVAVTALRPIMDDDTSADAAGSAAATAGAPGALVAPGSPRAEPSTDDGTGTTGSTAAPNDTGLSAASDDLPVITKEKPRGKPPTVQAGKTYTLKADLLFETGSTDLTTNARSDLQQMADIIRAEHVTGTIQVNGYTDDVGNSEDNLQLSRDRAQAVAEGLRNELSGVPLELLPQGFGEPKDPDTSTSGRQQNRKVVIVLPNPKATATPSSDN